MLLFAQEEHIPFAYRSPIAETEKYSFSKGKPIDRIGQFELSYSDKQVICRYLGEPSLYAVVEMLENGDDLSAKADTVINYLRNAYSLDLSHADIKRCEDLTAYIAEKCGCLTDICRDDLRDVLFNNDLKPDSAVIAIALPIIALMYRRISAKRGFNFKIAFADGLACFIFSARVILQNDHSDIPEHRVLSSISANDGVALAAKLNYLGEECEGGGLYKLSIAFCPQSIDPRGILRAPEWKKQTESILSRIDIDLDGEF